MENILKVWLRKSQFIRDQNEFKAQVVIDRNIDAIEIVDALISEGLQVNAQIALDIIAQFNKKAAKLVLSGNQVDTGLVVLSPEIRGSIFNRKWSPESNKPIISIQCGNEMLVEIDNTKVEIIENPTDSDLLYKQDEQINYPVEEIKRENLIFGNNEPACGIAFRRWLCNA